MKENNYVKGLVPPKNLNINFKPSERQYEVWKALQPECPNCGGTVIHVQSGVDKNGNPTYKPKCSKCGNENIPQIILAGGAAGGGKAETLDSKICTPTGFKYLRDIKVGDFVTSPLTGGAQKVIALHPIEKHEYYKVKFIDGAEVECSEGHLWQCHISKHRTKRFLPNGERVDERVMQTKDMYQWYLNKANGINSRQSLIIPLTEPVKFTVSTAYNRSRITDPYVLGAMLGNGCMTRNSVMHNTISFVTMDNNVIERIISCGYIPDNTRPSGQATTYLFNSSKLQDDLNKAGVLNHQHDEKFIPDLYKYATIEERKQLMQGLMDTDGYVDNRGHFSYCTTSKKLAEDIAFVVRSLGGKATITDKIGAYKDQNGNKIECKTAYNVRIMTKFDPELVSTPRKKERARYGFNGGSSELGRRIISIEPIGKKLGRCITVDEPCGLYVTNDFIVTHNSYLGSCWLISSCLRWPDMRMVVGRKTLKSLRESTWNTILTIVKDWGLIEGVNYKVNNLSGEMVFYNGSKIIMKELCFQPSDNQYLRFGSSEFSGAFIDEAGELDEKAVDVLFSRIRWNIPKSTVIPKMMLSTNPCLGWIRSRFVIDDEGNDVKCRQYERYIPYSIYDNPIPEFRMQYLNSLSRISDKTTRERLQYGNWQWVESNDFAAYWKFDGSKHLVDSLREKSYNPTKPLVLSFDFNVSPYMSCLVLQFDYDNKTVNVLEEILGKPKEKTNNTPALTKIVKERLLQIKHTGGIIVTGDPAGKARSTQTEDGTNNYTIITDALKNPVLRPKLKLFNKQPSQLRRLEFVNELFENYEGWKIQIDIRCRKLTEDLVYQKKNEDGTKCKQKVADPDNPGSKFEKYGHLSDCFDYALCYFLSDAWSDFQCSKQQIATTTADVYNDYDY